ncbi:type II toxin-antitoxin system HipA family toxin, partial [Escherichia coli]|nr:type II toxin-antitoxin system HipA family toxin [Escherichia coli]
MPIGLLVFEGGSSRRVGRFAYSSGYLASEGRKPIDPIGLPLGNKWRHAALGEVHLAFHDAGPDGRVKGILPQLFPELELGMPEFLALGGLSR